MGWRVVKQPNGKYAIWSTIIDHFILYDAEREDVLAEFVKAATIEATRSTEECLKRADDGTAPRGLGPYRWGECLEEIKEVHGGETLAEFLKEYETTTKEEP